MKNEKMLAEMMSENFIEIAKDEQEIINGGISEDGINRVIAMYSTRPINWIGKRALYSVSPTKPIKQGHEFYSLYAVQPKLNKY